MPPASRSWRLFAFTVVAARSTFSVGLIAAIIPMAMFLLGPTLEFVGFGLSEIASASFIYLAAFFAMRNRGTADVVIAGVLVILGFYTRLNNLPMAVAVAAFALPVTFPAGDLWRPRRWWPLVQWRVVIGIGGGLAIGAALFAWRTWYYTGVFGVFHGTQREFLAVWKPGMSAMEAVPAMMSSLMMVLTASDPPQLAWHALPLLAGALIAVAAVCAVPGFRDAPLAGGGAVPGRVRRRARDSRLGARRAVLDSPVRRRRCALRLGAGSSLGGRCCSSGR